MLPENVDRPFMSSRYCQAQRTNAKTKAVLEKSFAHLGEVPKSVLVTRYMYEVLFDHEFHYDMDDCFKARLQQDTDGLGGPSTAEVLKRSARNIHAGAEQLVRGACWDPERDAPSPPVEPKTSVQGAASGAAPSSS
jgi:hypothetical protein